MSAHLKKFKSCLKRPTIFADAHHGLPSFLEDNLQDQARVVKCFKHDPSALIRIFYFQFLKLCFETEDVDYNSKLEKLIGLIQENPSYLRMPIKYCEEHFDHAEVNKLVMDFLQLLGQGNRSVYPTLSQYPIIDEILTNFFRIYLENLPQKKQIKNQLILERLCNIFQIDIVEYDNCFQFIDTQVYAYIVSLQQIYLVFIDQEKALRNTKINTNSNQNDFWDQESVENQQREPIEQKKQVISFYAPEMVFNETDAGFGSSQKKQNLVVTQETFTREKQQVKFQQEKNVALKEITNEKYPINKLFGPIHKKDISNKYDINISKEFTDTFILNQLPQPFQNKIKSIKAKARAERKTRQMFF